MIFYQFLILILMVVISLELNIYFQQIWIVKLTPSFCIREVWSIIYIECYINQTILFQDLETVSFSSGDSQPESDTLVEELIAVPGRECSDLFFKYNISILLCFVC